MDTNSLFSDLTAQFPTLTIKQNEPLAPYTTLKIGGPADLFIHTKSPQEFEDVLKYLASLRSNSYQLTPMILGNGSNVLISDKGIRGIVIHNTSNSIEVLSDSVTTATSISSEPAISNHRTQNHPDLYLDFTKIDYDESTSPRVQVRMSSGTPLPFAINSLLSKGITGLQWFAYIPGTIGGAIWYNIHGGNYHLSQFIDSVRVFDLSSSTVTDLPSSQLNWDYDSSHFQDNPSLVIISAVFNLYQGDADRARATASAWIAQKVKVQPMNSAGSVFKNPKLEDCQRLWGEQKSTGWIIDQQLQWKGRSHGGATIGPQHANIFTNQNHATASDFLALITEVKTEVKSRFNITLEPEVKMLGEF